MAFGWDDAIMLALQAASAGGGILGGKKKQIDPEWLKQHFGPEAVSEEALNLFNRIINSPRGQQLMASAAEQGQRFSNQVNANAAAAGLTSAGGAASGTGIFATAAGDQASNAFQRDVRGNLFSDVLPLAQQSVQGRMDAVLGDRARGGVQTDSARTWQQIGQAAGTALATQPGKTAATPTTPAPAASTINAARSLVWPGAESVAQPAQQRQSMFKGAANRLGRWSSAIGRTVSRLH